MADEHTPYKQGFIDGMTAFAWMRDGTYWLGSGMYTLRSRVEVVETIPDYNPDFDEAVKALVQAARDYWAHIYADEGFDIPEYTDDEQLQNPDEYFGTRFADALKAFGGVQS